MKLAAVIKEIVQTKGVSEELVLDAVKEVMSNAYKEFFGASETEFDINLNKDTFKVLIPKQIVKRVRDPRNQINIKHAESILGVESIPDGTEIVKVPFSPVEDFTPTEIMKISESILNKIREFEKNALRYEYSKKKIEIVSGTIIKINEKGDIFVDLGKTIGYLPFSEQSPLEHYENGDSIKATIIALDNITRHPRTGKKIKKLQVTLSRKNPNLIKELLFSEIPEVADKVIEIKGIVRLAGYKTKVLVYTNSSVDPVAACIGPHGVRILSIIKEIGGEKIDIIKYSDDIKELIRNALSPAKVDRVIIPSAEEKLAYVVVSLDQLPYAFGKQKQNVILASKLCGYKIQVKTDAEIEEKNIEEEGVKELKNIFGTTLSVLNLDEEVLNKLHNHEIFSVEHLAEIHINNLYHQLDTLTQEEIEILKKSLLENVEIEEDNNPVKEIDEQQKSTEEIEAQENKGTPLEVLTDLKEEWIKAFHLHKINSLEELVERLNVDNFESIHEITEEDKKTIIEIIVDNIEIEE